MSDDLTRLQRWEDAGGTWRLVARVADAVTLSLRTCDGGEEMERLNSDERDLVSYVVSRE